MTVTASRWSGSGTRSAARTVAVVIVAVVAALALVVPEVAATASSTFSERLALSSSAATGVGGALADGRLAAAPIGDDAPQPAERAHIARRHVARVLTFVVALAALTVLAARRRWFLAVRSTAASSRRTVATAVLPGRRGPPLPLFL